MSSNPEFHASEDKKATKEETFSSEWEGPNKVGAEDFYAEDAPDPEDALDPKEAAEDASAASDDSHDDHEEQETETDGDEEDSEGEEEDAGADDTDAAAADGRYGPKAQERIRRLVAERNESRAREEQLRAAVEQLNQAVFQQQQMQAGAWQQQQARAAEEQGRAFVEQLRAQGFREDDLAHQLSLATHQKMERWMAEQQQQMSGLLQQFHTQQQDTTRQQYMAALGTRLGEAIRGYEVPEGAQQRLQALAVEKATMYNLGPKAAAEAALETYQELVGALPKSGPKSRGPAPSKADKETLERARVASQRGFGGNRQKGQKASGRKTVDPSNPEAIFDDFWR